MARVTPLFELFNPTFSLKLLLSDVFDVSPQSDQVSWVSYLISYTCMGLSGYTVFLLFVGLLALGRRHTGEPVAVPFLPIVAGKFPVSIKLYFCHPG